MPYQVVLPSCLRGIVGAVLLFCLFQPIRRKYAATAAAFGVSVALIALVASLIIGLVSHPPPGDIFDRLPTRLFVCAQVLFTHLTIWSATGWLHHRKMRVRWRFAFGILMTQALLPIGIRLSAILLPPLNNLPFLYGDLNPLWWRLNYVGSALTGTLLLIETLRPFPGIWKIIARYLRDKFTTVKAFFLNQDAVTR